MRALCKLQKCARVESWSWKGLSKLSRQNSCSLLAFFFTCSLNICSCTFNPSDWTFLLWDNRIQAHAFFCVIILEIFEDSYLIFLGLHFCILTVLEPLTISCTAWYPDSPPLNLFLFLTALFELWCPELYTVFQMRFDQSRVE